MKEIVEFVKKNVNRNGKVRRQVVGVLYARRENENCAESASTLHIGWSKANTKMGDEFDKDAGLTIAIGRSKGQIYNLPPVALSIRNDIRKFENRCKRYFKGNTIETVLDKTVVKKTHMPTDCTLCGYATNCVGPCRYNK